MNFKKVWNNRIFRTFIQTVIGVILAYFAKQQFDINSKELIALLISAIATGLAAIMPLFEEDENERN